MRVVAIGLAVLLLASCSDGDDTAAPTTAVTAESPVPPDEYCPDRASPLSPGELTAELLLPVEFVEGDVAVDDGSSAAGHTHTGPLVPDGEAHLHYCLGVANGYEQPVSLSAIQVLPDAEEEPLAMVEADSLTEAFVEPREGERIAASDSSVLEILVPADGPVDQLHQRIAYTVEDPTTPRDLFLDITLPADG